MCFPNGGCGTQPFLASGTVLLEAAYCLLQHDDGSSMGMLLGLEPASRAQVAHKVP